MFLGISQRVQKPVDTFAEQGVLVKLDGIGREMAYLPGKGLERLLEEPVYGTDRKGAVVMEDIAQQLFRSITKRTGVGTYRRHELFEIIRFLRPDGKFMELFQYPFLHLVRRLVCKGHCKDMPVGMAVTSLEHGPYIFQCQIPGLTRTGRSLQYLYHNPFYLPQIILKSQYAQVSLSSVLKNGTSLLFNSASRPANLSSISLLKRTLSGNITGGFLKISAVE